MESKANEFFTLHFLLYLICRNSQSIHERISENLLSEVAAWHGLHGKEGDALVVVIYLAEYLAESVVSISILRIWDYHHSLHFLGVAYGACHIYEEVILDRKSVV